MNSWKAWCAKFDPPIKSARDLRHNREEYAAFKKSYSSDVTAVPCSQSKKRSLCDLMADISPPSSKKPKVDFQEVKKSNVPIIKEIGNDCPTLDDEDSKSQEVKKSISQDDIHEQVPDCQGVDEAKMSKRCQNRGWSLVYPRDDDIDFDTQAQNIWKTLSNSRYGVYQGFAIGHSGEEIRDHIHIGFIFRITPTHKKWTWDKVSDYFGKGVSVGVLKRKTREIHKKMDNLYNYCIDEEIHHGQTISGPILFKGYKPTLVVKTDGNAVDLGKCKTHVWFQYHLEQNSDLIDIYEKADLRRRADICRDLPSYQKMMNNYYLLTDNTTEYMDLDTFKPEVLELFEDWNHLQHSLVLRGPSCMGKTELAKALLKARTDQFCLLVSNINKLIVHRHCQPILYDDMTFEKCSREKVICLTDLENDRDIRILFGIKTVSALTPKIFCTNKTLDEFFPADQYRAIDSRIKVIDLTGFGILYKGENPNARKGVK